MSRYKLDYPRETSPEDEALIQRVHELIAACNEAIRETEDEARVSVGGNSYGAYTVRRIAEHIRDGI